ncbi:MAG: type III-B CRISPR module RAMP protein Cmr6 [Ardenticatenaceae bacterium]|nr:type III-B CRISPR module RAMP protein Cmr6 [Ardenticatenaceae bacterium]
MSSLPIPHESAVAYAAHKNEALQNPALLFDRFIPDLSRRDDKEAKKRALQEIQRATEKASKELLEAWGRRWEVSVRAANARPFVMTTEWRFVTGLGRKGPLEVGFTFHRYGFPFLPGSSVKGIARAYAETVKDLKEGKPDFDAIFGRAADKDAEDSLAGGAIFYDAIPMGLPKIDVDVMTPHFPSYYREQGNKNPSAPPTDHQDPNPIPFLTVARGVRFRFAVGWRGQLDDDTRRLRDMAEQWLISGLTTLGAGAKTSAGYGFFSDLDVAATVKEKAEFRAEVGDPDEGLINNLIRAIEAIPPDKVAPNLPSFYERWRHFQGSLALKRKLAEAIRDKGQGRVSKKARQSGGWYDQVLQSLQEGED